MLLYDCLIFTFIINNKIIKIISFNLFKSKYNLFINIIYFSNIIIFLKFNKFVFLILINTNILIKRKLYVKI